MVFSIRFKIVFITVAILLFAIGASILISSYFFTSEYSSALKAEATAIAQDLKLQLDRLLRFEIPIEELIGFEEQCQDIVKRYKDISYAMVLNLEGTILFHNDPSQHNKLSTDSTKVNDLKGEKEVIQTYSDQGVEYFDITVPVFGIHGEHIAAVRIGFPEKVITQKTRRLIAYSAGGTSVFLGFAIILLVSILYIWVTKPIRKLVDGIQGVRKKGTDFTQMVEIKSKDEIGELGSAFNQMVSELIQSDEMIKKYTQELELKVDERTKELRMINKQLNQDILKRKRTEEALRESEKKYRILVERANDGIAIVQDKLIKLTNPRLAQLSGYTHEELVDTPFINYFHHNEFQKVVNIYKSHMSGEDVPKVYESEIMHKDGHRIDIDISGVIITYKGKPADLVFIRDITERKRAEEEKKELEERLQRSEKMEAIGQLGGGVAHDLNNVLTGIVGYPELLLMQLPEKSPLRASILAIQKSGQKAAEIVQDLLTLARRGVAVTEVVNLNDIISDYLRSPEHEKITTYHTNVHYEIKLETNLLNILCSPIHISKTLMNLVSNAVEALPDGGKVTISTKNQYVDMPIKSYDKVEEGDYVVLIVSDNGIGISAEDLGKIFEPFYTKKVMGRSGTGLGMAVVWGTVKDHKGYIDVHSRVGEGTAFELYFPITRKEAAGEKIHISIEEYMGNGEKILVVDDVPEQRNIASELLTILGYAVNVVSSGEEAVEYMHANSADLLVLDMIMDPGIDGLETYKRILELHSGQKAIIVSGFSETEQVREAQRLGAGQYIRKPYTLEKIGLTVKEELE